MTIFGNRDDSESLEVDFSRGFFLVIRFAARKLHKSVSKSIDCRLQSLSCGKSGDDVSVKSVSRLQLENHSRCASRHPDDNKLCGMLMGKTVTKHGASDRSEFRDQENLRSWGLMFGREMFVQTFCGQKSKTK